MRIKGIIKMLGWLVGSTVDVYNGEQTNRQPPSERPPVLHKAWTYSLSRVHFKCVSITEIDQSIFELPESKEKVGR